MRSVSAVERDHAHHVIAGMNVAAPAFAILAADVTGVVDRVSGSASHPSTLPIREIRDHRGCARATAS